MDMTTEGDFGLPGGLDMTLDMDLAARSTYDIEEGPDPETVRLTVSTDIVDGSASMEMLGMTEAIPLDDLAGEMATFDMEMVIDAQGNVVEMLVGGQAIPVGLLDGLGGAGSGSLLSGFDSGQLLGPELPEGPISVGSTWTTEVNSDGFGLSFHSRSEHTIAATEVVAGHDTYRIETVTTTDEISLNFEDLMTALAENSEDLAALSGENISGAELEAALGMFAVMGIEMNYRMDRSVAETTTWFDAAGGVVVRMEMTSPQRASIEMTGIPDTGDIEMVMDMTMTTTMQLTG